MYEYDVYFLRAQIDVNHLLHRVSKNQIESFQIIITQIKFVDNDLHLKLTGHVYVKMRRKQNVINGCILYKQFNVTGSNHVF